jgi:shikimate kinase
MGGILFLTGFMGTGKTAVGAALARRLGRPFVDLDREIESAAGLTVAEIFARHGEAEFRARERALLERLAGRGDTVVATGGGAVVDARNRRAMRASGRIVCLTAAPATLLERVGGGDDRPLLAGADRAERVRELLAARAAAYADADATIDTTAKTVREIVDEIVAWLASAGGEGAAAKDPGAP